MKYGNPFDAYDDAVNAMLKAGDYASVYEWAQDSGYLYNADWDEWYDDEGYCVDVYDKAVDAADSAGYFGEVK